MIPSKVYRVVGKALASIAFSSSIAAVRCYKKADCEISEMIDDMIPFDVPDVESVIEGGITIGICVDCENAIQTKEDYANVDGEKFHLECPDDEC